MVGADAAKSDGGRRAYLRIPADCQRVTNTTVTLSVISDSGLPVQYFVVSGPVELDGAKRTVTAIPPRAKFPIRVTVAACQCARTTDPRIQSAGPVVRSFLISKQRYGLA